MHQIFWSKNVRISHLQKVQNKIFSVISKHVISSEYHIKRCWMMVEYLNFSQFSSFPVLKISCTFRKYLGKIMFWLRWKKISIYSKKSIISPFPLSEKFIILTFPLFLIWTSLLFKVNHLNIIKEIKKDYKRKLVKDIKIFLKKNKKKKREYGGERYKNISKERKNELAEYRKTL